LTNSWKKLKNKYQRKDDADVLINVQDIYGKSKQFKAHKPILNYLSKFFESMMHFQGNTNEVIEIAHETPFSIDGFEYFLNCLYGMHEDMKEDSDDLLIMFYIDFYQLTNKKNGTTLQKNVH